MAAKCSLLCSRQTDTELDKCVGYGSYPYLFNIIPLIRGLQNGLFFHFSSPNDLKYFYSPPWKQRTLLISSLLFSSSG